MILPKKHTSSNSNSNSNDNDNDTKNNNITNNNDNDKKFGKSVEGQEGLSLIANWIEVIIQRVKINVNNLRIRIADNDDAINNICISIPTIEYYNTHPSSISSVSSSTSANGKTIILSIIIIILINVTRSTSINVWGL